MKILNLMSLCFISLSFVAQVYAADVKNPVVEMQTSMGEIRLELFQKEAPKSVANFLRYVDGKKYDGTIFHRVIDGFMIQGGGFDEKMDQRSTFDPIENEATNGLSNTEGTVAMARTNVVNSATAQFFINVTDNNFLNHRTTDPSGYGYAVFGRVIKGMPVVNAIKKVATSTKGMYQNVPVSPVIIKTVRRVP